MSTPHGMLEGQSITCRQYFNGQHYSWWKNKMKNYIQAEDYELWILIKNGPLIPTKVVEDGTKVHKQPDEFDAETTRRRGKTLWQKNYYILALVQMRILAFLSASQPKTYGMPFK